MLSKLKYLFFLLLPVIAVAVWYSPVLFKGYSLASPNEQIVLAKNIAKTGMYAAESDLNVLLASGLIKEKAHLSFVGNKLTAYLYSFIFKLFGFLSWNKLVLFSAIINAIALLVFSFLVFYLFNFRTSLVFSLIYVFFPFVWQTAIQPGGYEFALLFLSFFFLFYFLGSTRPALYALSGIFLTLACLARETFLLFIPIFFLYLLLKKERKMIALIFIPIFIVLSVFYLPDFLANRNTYLELLPVIKPSEKLKINDFMTYSLLYPDPYTYHFDKDNFLKEYTNRGDSAGLVTSLYLEKGMTNVDVGHLGLGRRILLGFLLLIGNVGRFISWEEMGGPFIFILMLLGLFGLKKEKPQLFQMFSWLILGIIFLISFVVLVGRSHFVDFGWILALLAALGLLFLFENFKTSHLLSVFVLFLVLYNMVLANHTYWGRVYDNKENLMVLEYASMIDELSISDKDVIALGGSGIPTALSLNYLKDKSLIVFQQRTIEKLLADGKLNSVFKNFGVTHILGYPEDLSKKITKSADVTNIGSSEGGEGGAGAVSFENYGLKNWLMNFIR